MAFLALAPAPGREGRRLAAWADLRRAAGHRPSGKAGTCTYANLLPLRQAAAGLAPEEPLYPMMMNRREVLQRLALLCGGVLSAELTAGLHGQVTNTGPSVAPDTVRDALLAEVCDTI